MNAEEILVAEFRAAQAEIDAAYWRFCFCRRAAPPSIAARRAYEDRARLRRALRAIGVEPPFVGS